MGRTKRVLDTERLYLEVLDTIRPELAETIRMESAIAETPVTIVVTGGAGADHPSVREYVGDPKPGKIVIDDAEDGGAMLAAGMVTDQLVLLYNRVARSGGVSETALFGEVLSNLDPALSELLELESLVIDGEVDVNVDGEGDGEVELGVIHLGVGDDSETVKAAAQVAERLWGMFERASFDEPAEQPGLLKRLFRRS